MDPSIGGQTGADRHKMSILFDLLMGESHYGKEEVCRGRRRSVDEEEEFYLIVLIVTGQVNNV